MGLRLILAIIAAVMTVVSAGLFASEYRIFKFTRSLTSLQARAAAENALPVPRSGWAQIEMTQYCIERLNDQTFILFPQAMQTTAYESCAALAERLIARNPAHAEALAIRAFSQAALGHPVAQVQADLRGSQRAAPQLTWLADRRLSFGLAFAGPAPRTPAWDQVLSAEAGILLDSEIGSKRLAQIYADSSDFRDLILPRAELKSEEIQRRFLYQVRQIAQSGSEVLQ